MRLIATEEAFAPREYFEEYLKLAETLDTAEARYLKMYYKGPLVERLSDMDVRLAEMDRFGVDMHLLGITAPGVQAFAPQLGGDMAERANDELAKVIRAHPTRFAGLGAVAPQDPERAAGEVKRIMTELKLGGVIINSHTQGDFLDAEKVSPLLEALVAHDAPLYIHPNFPPPSMVGPYSDYGMMGALWGFGAECSLHVVRMIMAGVFDRFPKLKVVLGHLGEGLPFWLDRLDNRYANILRRGGLEPLGMRKLERLPSEYFRTNFHITTSGMNTTAPLEFALKMFGPDRIMFAIDYPYEQTEEAVGFLRSASLDAGALRKIAHETAETVFNIASVQDRVSV
ncbi:amidohydrolase family protein [Caulobacter sp. S45]|uniref:amidohydrolase family protein n=1 Tax=Caulobacter sp. S45 TaxID=1641861 RepID=UPI001575DD00|nr:amidohydrolase family protein [Caulobacter sp. S45]